MYRLDQAMAEAAVDILAGEDAIEVLAGTAREYGLRLELLERKFGERYGPPETLFARHGAGAERARKQYVSEAEFGRWLMAELRKP
jgi:hypothetical protein